MAEAAYIRRLLVWICVLLYQDVCYSKPVFFVVGLRCFLSPRRWSLTESLWFSADVGDFVVTSWSPVPKSRTNETEDPSFVCTFYGDK
ncbi:hypothetical protein C8J56DRAFT_1049719 [Mycena floridula]|nr:hypothetical protein C8J56DRAFT_1052353 [Mycena floridula]KAJ7588791.1 hypothetical protein C8J56DRAFT_1049719 [Mycena floridula]